MKSFIHPLMLLLALSAPPTFGSDFPEFLTKFKAFENNPVFRAGNPGEWDEAIRERGWILKEGEDYYLWYTGYRLPEDSVKHLGLATSKDGIHWTRDPHNPIYSDSWVEDMTVVRRGETYYMFAEGRDDEMQLLSSTDKIHWNHLGKIEIRKVDGSPISPGPFGTPTVYGEGDDWWLFYERNDEAIWVARSEDLLSWKNVRDDPVLLPGPDAYDKEMIAMNQVMKIGDRYYATYHGLKANTRPQEWTTNLATSADLLNWEKYENNPILEDNKSSGIFVNDGERLRLYTMHPEVCLHFSEGDLPKIEK
ncbi:MAG: glycosylase [Candidatus Omnitrophica bacterium]|nr:glycosylase [Candidatus Omnitrophota bacterium]